MKKIGITGNIASGKTAVENIISNYGFKILDTDLVCHNLLNNDKNIMVQILNLFKDFDVLDENNKLDRRKIGEIIFSDNEYKKKLENILHPYVIETITAFFNDNTDEKLLFVSVPLLFEVNMQHLFDAVILVTADEKIRLNRLLARNGYTNQHALERINAQMKQEDKINLADFVIDNNSDLEQLTINTEKVLKNLL